MRWSCRVLVSAWLAIACTGLALTPVVRSPDPVMARVLPLAEPAREPDPPAPDPPAAEPEPPAFPEPEPQVAKAEPPPDPEPPPEPEAEAEPPADPEVPVGAAEFASGSALLDGVGDFPALSFSYEQFPSFRAYARAMTALGARFVVVRSREIVGEWDLEAASIGPVRLAARFSPRARDYTGEPGLFGAARAARERFGAGAVVMMLVPRALDAGLFGGIARVLAEHGERHDRVREVRGRYERTAGGGIGLRVESAVRRDGSHMELPARFDLDRIARSA